MQWGTAYRVRCIRVAGVLGVGVWGGSAMKTICVMVGEAGSCSFLASAVCVGVVRWWVVDNLRGLWLGERVRLMYGVVLLVAGML